MLLRNQAVLRSCLHSEAICASLVWNHLECHKGRRHLRAIAHQRAAEVVGLSPLHVLIDGAICLHLDWHLLATVSRLAMAPLEEFCGVGHVEPPLLLLDLADHPVGLVSNLLRTLPLPRV